MQDAELSERLAFMQLDQESREALRALRPLIRSELSQILDLFYEQVRRTPQTSVFFRDASLVESAKSRQLAHWNGIAAAEFGEGYIEKVRAIGRTHARIGLEPRWYIGGYAMVLSRLVQALVASRKSRGLLGGSGQEAKLNAAIDGLVKAAFLDMDLSISIYLDAAEESRKAAEATQAQAAREQTMAVQAVSAGLARLADGDLTCRMSDELPPAYRQLADDFNTAVGKLQEAMALIAANADGIATGAQEISEGADNLSRRTEHQAATLEQTAAAVEQITATVKRTADGSGQANAAVSSARSDAEKSGEVVRRAVSAMSGIEKSASEIGQIIGVIDEIAFQTNLLALNAGVEAARAGDAGKGFAVVAQEVRALAQRSAEAAKEIKVLISNSTDQVKEGTLLVGETGEALQRIVAQVAEISGVVAEIAASAQEQAASLAEVNTAVDQMDQVTQQNAAMVEQSTAASHALAREAQQLAALVGRFETGRRTTAAARPDQSRAPPAARRRTSVA